MVKVKLIEKAQMYAFHFLVARFDTRWQLKRVWKCWCVMVWNVSDLKENGWVECVSFLYRNERMCMFWLLVDLYIKRYENHQERKNRDFDMLPSGNHR